MLEKVLWNFVGNVFADWWVHTGNKYLNHFVSAVINVILTESFTS